MAEGQSTTVPSVGYRPSAIPVGARFGRLVVRSGPFKSPIGKNGYYRCECDCGNVRDYYGCDLVRGRSKSCRCLMVELAAKNNATHGSARKANTTHEYMIWQTMKARCYRPACKEYPKYGGRGIVVCERWRESFEAFLADMGTKPGKGYSLDRIDNDGPYSPENCRWATQKQQCRNTRVNRLLTHAGETLCLREWSERTGIPESAIRSRLRMGWEVARALTTPPDPRFVRSKR